MTSVHVVRHGEVENPNKILYGRQNGWFLSKRGEEMAKTLGEWAKPLNIGAIHALTSRARTANCATDG
jgi:broad specificity phosphatase PhoE